MGAALRKLEPIEFVIRPGVDADVPFVTHAWARGQVTAAPWCWQDKRQFTALQNVRMSQALADENRVCLVATLPDEPDEGRLGFIVGAGGAWTLDVNWIYVRENFRGRGIARALLEGLGLRLGVEVREVVGRGWSKAAPGLVAALRRNCVPFRWAP